MRLGLNFLLTLILVLSAKGLFAQGVDQDYDQRIMEGPVTPFEEEDIILRKKKIESAIRKIQMGDKRILKLVTYDMLQAIHDEVLRRAFEKIGNVQGMQKATVRKNVGYNFYRILGWDRALPSFLGCLDNADPKVRLKCIGYLGDWVDDIGQKLDLIELDVDKRLASKAETRPEVRYALQVLKWKIVRRKVLTALKNGDDQVLITISPNDFLPIVFYEPRIRTIYFGNPRAIQINSIRLDRGVNPITGAPEGEFQGRDPKLDIENICYTKEITEGGGCPNCAAETSQAGYRNLLAQAVRKAGERAIDWKCLRALFSGLNNRSLFVREHTIRILLNYVKGLTANPNYTRGDRVYSEEFKKYFADDPYVVRVSQVAWDNVKYAEFYYWDNFAPTLDAFRAYTNPFEYAYWKNIQNKPVRYFTNKVTLMEGRETEVTGNYRNDIREWMHLIGQEYYLFFEYVPEAKVKEEKVARRAFGPETLFNREREDILQGTPVRR